MQNALLIHGHHCLRLFRGLVLMAFDEMEFINLLYTFPFGCVIFCEMLHS
jgi:hypothetical protein